MKSRKNSKNQKISIIGLSRKFGCDRESVRKLVQDVSTVAEAEEAIKTWQSGRGAPKNGTPECDPETGLTWWQAKLREDVLKSRAQRERDEALDGGELVPVAVIEKALEVVAQAWDRFPTEFYAYGGTLLTAQQREAFDRLAKQAKADYQSYVRSWLDRESEIRKENGAKSE